MLIYCVEEGRFTVRGYTGHDECCQITFGQLYMMHVAPAYVNVLRCRISFLH